MSARTRLGWWKAPMRFLPWRRIDAGLAADGGIDLGEQRGRDLHEANASAGHGGGETREIAHDAAAERDHQIAALDAGLKHRVANGRQRSVGFASPPPAATVTTDVRRPCCCSDWARGSRIKRPTFASVTIAAARAPSAAMRAPASAIRPRPTKMS